LRDFVFVGDCVSHLLWHWKNPSPNGLYNSGTGAPRSFLDLARAVFYALGLVPNVSFIDMPADLARQYQSYTCADCTKLRAAGCDVRATELEAGVRETVAWLEGGSVPLARAA
jgi:ADP-L-glycero-D-manno-heptose 6-epimerase